MRVFEMKFCDPRYSIVIEGEDGYVDRARRDVWYLAARVQGELFNVATTVDPMRDGPELMRRVLAQLAAKCDTSP